MSFFSSASSFKETLWDVLDTNRCFMDFIIYCFKLLHICFGRMFVVVCIFIIIKLIINLMRLDRNEWLLMYYSGSWSYFGCSFLKRGTKALTQHRTADGWWTIWSICRQTKISRLKLVHWMLDRNVLFLVIVHISVLRLQLVKWQVFFN